MVDRDYEFVSTKHLFEQLRMFQSVRIKPHMMAEMDFDIDFNDYILRLEEYVLAQKIANDTYTGYNEVSAPETTFQMFKATNQNKWWARWFVKRWPVRYHTDEIAVTVQVARYLKYPEHELHIKTLGRPVIHEEIERVR